MGEIEINMIFVEKVAYISQLVERRVMGTPEKSGEVGVRHKGGSHQFSVAGCLEKSSEGRSI